MEFKLVLQDYELAVIRHSLSATLEYVTDNDECDVLQLDGKHSVKEIIQQLLEKIK